MARDEGLEELLRDDLDDVPGLSETAMFGGLAWLLDGHLLCAARAGVRVSASGRRRATRPR